MGKEYFEVSPSAVKTISEAINEKRRIIAVGTTTCRVLETIADNIKTLTIHPMLERQRIFRASLIRGWTDLFIHPEWRFKLVNTLITNFHLPYGTPLALVYAFACREKVSDAYNEAISRGYRFYSYGDAMLILRDDGI
jgi:S-adenosylmethionine:tRNA ribosyltransferase-isomerase